MSTYRFLIVTLLFLVCGPLVSEEVARRYPLSLKSDSVGPEPGQMVAPVLSDPDLSVDGDVAIGADTRVFRAGQLFLHSSGDVLALGDLALAENVSGDHSTAVGWQALSSNTSGDWNTAVGSQALESNTEGEKNTAVGAQALQLNRKGNGAYYAYAGLLNTAVGFGAMRNNTGGQFNTAVGAEALATGNQISGNTAVGYEALRLNGAGANTAIGTYALESNISGRNNIAVGFGAGSYLQISGDPAPAETDFNIFIGHDGVVDDHKTIRIGDARQLRTFVTGILEESVPVGVAKAHVCILDTDQLVLCDAPDSAWFLKEEIKPLDGVSPRILDLQPVSFRFKPQYAARREGPQFGLIAEEVAAVMPELVGFSEEGEPVAVHYDRLIPLLLNEVQRLHRQVAEQRLQLERLAAGR